MFILGLKQVDSIQLAHDTVVRPFELLTLICKLAVQLVDRKAYGVVKQARAV